MRQTSRFQRFQCSCFFLCENRNYTFLLLQKSNLQAEIRLLIGLGLNQLMSPTSGPACWFFSSRKKHLSLLLKGCASNDATVNILPVVLTATIIAHSQHATLRCDSPRSWMMPPLLKSKQRLSAGFPLEGSLQGLSHRALKPASRPLPSSSSAATAACHAAVHAGSRESTSSDTMRPACFSL